jgi:hypothetical protein
VVLDPTGNQVLQFWISNLGDQYISSLINTVLYFVSFVAVILKWRNLSQTQALSGERNLWLFLIFIILALGINKQLDFQSLLIAQGREIARSMGLLDMRRQFQALFVYALSVTIGCIVLFLIIATRKLWRRNTPAFLGLGILCIYIVTRASSMSHLGFIAESAGTNKGGLYRITDIIEFFGILPILINAMFRDRKEHRETSESFGRPYKVILQGLSILVGLAVTAFSIYSFEPYFDIGSLAIGNWNPKIGDPSYMGWFTVFLYYYAAGVCFLNLFTRRVQQQRQEWVFWGFICFSLVVLGLIKQFNLLSAVDEILRIISRSGGWYEQRRIVQALAMAIAGVGMLIFFVAVVRGSKIQFKTYHIIALLGFSYLLLFVILRGISLHQFDTFRSYKIMGAEVNWILELLGIFWISFSSFLKRAK